MNKLKLWVILPVLFMLLPNTIYADCTTEEKQHFNEIKDEFEIKYEYNRDTDSYTINLYNPDPDNYDFEVSSRIYDNCHEETKNNAVCEGISSGDYIISIIGITETCDDTFKKTTLNLSKQNEYWNDPLCEGIEEFVLCQPTYDKDIDYDTFVSRVNTYKKTKQKKATKEEEKKSNNVIDKVTDFLKENLFQIIISVVFIIAIVVTIILTAKSIRKSRRLE